MVKDEGKPKRPKPTGSGRKKGTKGRYKKKKNGKKATGRPEKEIDFDRLRDCARFMYTDEELSSVLQISYSLFKSKKTTDHRIQEAIDAGRANFKGSLRAKQINMAMGGDKTMLIWLGKQYLGQKEKVEHGHDPDNLPPAANNVTHNYNFANAEEAAAAFKARLQSPG